MYDFLETLVIETEVVHEKYRFTSDFNVREFCIQYKLVMESMISY
jgi:hypothetical protein